MKRYSRVSSALQNRLVGTAIVVAIAVIFLPDLLDGKQESKRNLFVELPQKPSMKTVKSPAPFDTSKVEEAATRKVEVISEQAIDDTFHCAITDTKDITDIVVIIGNLSGSLRDLLVECARF